MNHLVPGTISRRSEVVATIDRRVVHQNVNATPELNYFSGQFLHPDPIGYRDLERQGTPAVGFDLLTGFQGKIFAAVVVEGHISPLARKNLTNCSTDSSRSATDE